METASAIAARSQPKATSSGWMSTAGTAVTPAVSTTVRQVTARMTQA